MKAAGTRVILFMSLLIGCGRTEPAHESSDADAGSDASLGTVEDASDDGTFLDVVRDACADCNIGGGVFGGCCQEGKCIPVGEQTGSACGINALICAACSPNETCIKGSCASRVVGCNSTNCAGCCAGANFCRSGVADNGCGFGGNYCENCFAGGGVCNHRVAGGGSCSQPKPCGPATCDGCCEKDTCVSGLETSACGTNGLACATCKSGESCIRQGGPGLGGSCQSPPFCSPSNCSTCCKGNQCLTGDSDIACGEQSSICTDCTAGGAVCRSHQCVRGCSATSCKGCCQGGLCAAGDQDFACGKLGDLCSDCTTGHGRCSGQACVPP